LRELLTDKLEENRLLVWYDPGGTLEPIVERSVPKKTQLVQYRGSFLKLRIQIEQEGNLGNNRIIYIPAKPQKQSWIKDYELFGEKIELDLPKILRDQFKLQTTERTHLIFSPSNCKRLSDSWNQVLKNTKPPLTMVRLEEAILATLFGQSSNFDLKDAVLTFLDNPSDITDRLEKTGLKRVFLDTLQRNGIPPMEELEPFRVASALLLSELAYNSDVDDTNWENLIPVPDHRRLWSELTRQWASDRMKGGSFYTWSQKIESEYNIENIVTGCSQIENVWSFLAIDKVLLDEIKARITDGEGVNNIQQNASYIQNISEKRSKTIWAMSERAPEWQALKIVVDMINKIEHSLKNIDKKTLITDYYGNLWKIDQLYREITPFSRILDHSFRTLIIEPVAKYYQKWLTETNDALTEHIEDLSTWPVPDIKYQTDFWTSFINPKEKTCVFLLDALRFDLQKQLIEAIREKRHKVKHTPMLSCLPTITEICMPALLTKKQFNLKKTNGKVEVIVDNEIISNKQDRMNILENRYKDKISFLEINDFGEDLQKTSKKMGESELLIVSDMEIDRAGRFLSEDVLDYFDNQLERLTAVIDQISQLGYKKIIITTDHGFLLIPNPEKVETIKGFSSEGLITSRRYAIGIPPQISGTIIIPFRKMGYESDEELLLPRGISYLPRKGSKEMYIHGGLSLQECCIGVIEVELRSVGEKVKVLVELDEPIAGINFRVKLIPQAVQVLIVPRTVRVEIWHGSENIGESESIKLESTPVTKLLTLKKIESVDTVELRTVDVVTKETVFRKRINVSLEGYDDFLP